VLIDLAKSLTAGNALSPHEIDGAVTALVDESVSAEAKADFLIALARKRETPEEIAGFAEQLRERAIQPEIDSETRKREILDVCGTGGDRLNTFNISSTVAIIASAAGVTVAKHGNRAITSQSGSAEVLEELGVPVNLTPAQAADSLREHNFAFFFAPAYHPAFKHIALCRRICAERGQRTIFNLLGPCLNPARPTAQLVGVPRPEFTAPIAQVLQRLGVRRAMVVSGSAGGGWLDEMSTLGATHISEFYQDRGFNNSSSETEDFGLPCAELEDLKGGDRKQNAGIIRAILRGEERGPKRDAVLLNSGAALFVAGVSKSILEGIEQSAEIIDSGRAFQKLEQLVKSKPQ
jgi:anthranilate phosphoribosyltransferase